MVVTVAVVVVVVLLVLLVSGVLNLGGSSGSGVGTPVPYSQAVPVAIREGQNATGGPWTVVVAEGLGIPSSVSQVSPASATGNGCTFTNPPGASGVVSIDGTASSAAPGTVATWVFFAKNVSANVILLISVSNGQASPISLVTGCTFVSEFSNVDPISATGVVDSPAIASSFNSAGGAGFLKNNSGATEFFLLYGADPAESSSSFWGVEYDTCALTATSGTGSLFEGSFDATSGATIGPPTLSPTDC